MTERKFIEGMFTKEITTQFGVMTKLSFNENFIKFYNDNKNEKGYVNVDLKRGKDSKALYAELNTYVKPEEATTNEVKPETPESFADDFDDEIPF
jgi:hypothetical protein